VSLTTRTQKGGFLFSRPIEADLSVYSSYNWNRGDASPSKAIECYYDIVADPDTWLISGCKRAQFAVEVMASWAWFDSRMTLKRHSR